jgi:iron complex outermembrane receptor protein
VNRRTRCPNARTRLALALALALPAWGVQAQSAASVQLGDVNVTGGTDARLPRASGRLDLNSLIGKPSNISDTAQLLTELPGVSAFNAGGVSALPVIRGLADDRLRITVDGMDAIASCPNHMNAPLSYIDPSQVASVRVYAGITPVSAGGDSIGGSIAVESAAPQFAEAGQTLVGGEAGASVRSFGGRSLNLGASYATDRLSLSYRGATSQSDNYKAAKDFKTSGVTGNIGHTLPLDDVGSTAYETRNHQLGLAFKSGAHLIEAQANIQDLPYQLYPNQRMDMLDNQMKRFSLRYSGRFDWGTLSARAWHEKVDHYMDFGPDKRYWYGNGAPPTGSGGPAAPNGSPCAPLSMTCAAGMPMYTASRTDGAAVHAVLPLGERDVVRTGVEVLNYRLDDWWPPAPDCGVGNCIGGMAPLTFWNINDGRRDRKALYGEWEAKWTAQWTSQLGLRVEKVTMNTGTVTGYNSMALPGATNLSGMGIPLGSMYAGSSVAPGPGGRDAFNAMDRKRNDANWDLTAMAAYRPGETFNMQFGFARKTRSPNLYERYSWSSNTMAMVMNNFVGDGNGYIGNPDLKPETAHTLSLTGDWHSADREYQLVATPYYTRVNDYIDARRTYPGSTATNATATNSFVRLQYVNQEARLYGIDLSGRMPLARTGVGEFGLKGLLSYVNGRNTDTDDALYNIMPLNAKAVLTHRQGNWDNALELVLVKAKSDVSDVRNEIKTAGYSLVNLRGSYAWQKARVDFGVDNLFDKRYFLPLGGAYVGQGMTMSITGVPWGIAVPGMGRSLYAGLNVKF